MADKDEDGRVSAKLGLEVRPDGSVSADAQGSAPQQFLTRAASLLMPERTARSLALEKVGRGDPLTEIEEKLLAPMLARYALKTARLDVKVAKAQKVLPIVAEGIKALPPPKRTQSSDWFEHFRSFSGDVADPEMEDIWARILAGEYVRPGTYSIRTLAVLRDLDREYGHIDRMINNVFTGIVLMDGIDKKGIIGWLGLYHLVHEQQTGR